MTAPAPSDYPSYYHTYVDKVTDKNILNFLLDQQKEIVAYFESLPPEKWDYAYAPGKWTVKEVLGHLADAEVIFGYRALCIARGEKQSLPGFDENKYVAEGRFAPYSPAQLIEFWQSARKMNLASFACLDENALENKGVANNNPITMKAIPFIIGGHAHHHLEVLKERY